MFSSLYRVRYAIKYPASCDSGDVHLQLHRIMDDKTYNGWTNYATWRVNLEIIDGISWVKEDISGSEDKLTISDIMDFMRDVAFQAVTEHGTLEGLAVDYAMAFLDDVNWAEIARQVIENYPALTE